MGKKALVLSGGASKGAFTAGAVFHLGEEEKMPFDIAVGTSTGSLVGGPALIGGKEYFYLEEVYTTVTNNEILGESFLEKIIHGILGAPVDANMSPLYKLLHDYYLTKNKLKELIGTGRELVVTSVSVKTGQVHYLSSNQVRDEDIIDETFVRGILASCCEPVFTEPVRVYEHEPNPKYASYRNDLYYDGGLKEFMPIQKAIDLGAEEIYAICTHPLKDITTNWGSDLAPNNVPQLKALSWSLDSLLEENARGDRLIGRIYYQLDKTATQVEQLAKSYNLNQQQIDALVSIVVKSLPGERRLKSLYLISPDRDLPTSLEFDPNLMEGYFQKGKRTAEDFIKAKNSPQLVDLQWNDFESEQKFV